MKAPKIRSLFRNTRTQPRQFSFKSHLTSEVREDWEKRKRRVEDGLPRSISIRKRKGESKKAAITAMFRTIIIGTLLVYLTYRMIIWAETTEWGSVIEFIKSNG